MRLYFQIILFGVLFLIVLTSTLSAQKLDSVLNIYAEKYQPERMYIQFDKSSYTPGDTIWLKAYLVAGITPSEYSKTFYIDFCDANGKVLSHAVYPVVESSAKGSFAIPDTLKSGFIHVLAYTKWMLNFDSAFLYNKDIPVFQKNLSETLKRTNVPDIQFFPEAGDAIVGIKSKIAFKANDLIGKPVEVSGIVLNNKGVVIDSFKSIHNGMGFFYLNTAAGETYTANWIDNEKVHHNTLLPAAKASGAMFEVISQNNEKAFIVKRSDNVPDDEKHLHLVATMNQRMVYRATINLVHVPFIRGIIPVAQLPTGILKITLFDNNWNPLSERIVFVNNGDAVFNPDVRFTSTGLNKRGKNVIEINMPDSMKGNFSIAVTDGAIGTDSSDNIISHILLTSELKGKIYNPSYYFSHNGDSTGQQLDLVMLTNGWRRFNWGTIIKGILPGITYPKDTAYLALSGKVYSADSAALLANTGDIYLGIQGKDSSYQNLALPISSDGTFGDPSIVFFDTVKIYYQFLKNKNYTKKNKNFTKKNEVRFFSGLGAPSNTGFDKNYLLSDIDILLNNHNKMFFDKKEELDHLRKVETLKNVIVKARIKSQAEILDEKYTSGLFNGGDAYRFNISNEASAKFLPSIFIYLQGRVAGLQVKPGFDSTSLRWRGGTPLLFLNELQVDSKTLSHIVMGDVAYVKVFMPPFMGAFGGGSGAIAVYTKKGDEQTVGEEALLYKNVVGYTPVTEFYSPNYEPFDTTNEADDIRTTLYWNPMLITNEENHHIILTFYNNDVSNSFRVIMEGMSKDGRLTRFEKVVK